MARIHMKEIQYHHEGCKTVRCQIEGHARERDDSTDTEKGKADKHEVELPDPVISSQVRYSTGRAEKSSARTEQVPQTCTLPFLEKNTFVDEGNAFESPEDMLTEAECFHHGKYTNDDEQIPSKHNWQTNATKTSDEMQVASTTGISERISFKNDTFGTNKQDEKAEELCTYNKDDEDDTDDRSDTDAANGSDEVLSDSEKEVSTGLEVSSMMKDIGTVIEQICTAKLSNQCRPDNFKDARKVSEKCGTSVVLTYKKQTSRNKHSFSWFSAFLTFLYSVCWMRTRKASVPVEQKRWIRFEGEPKVDEQQQGHKAEPWAGTGVIKDGKRFRINQGGSGKPKLFLREKRLSSDGAKCCSAGRLVESAVGGLLCLFFLGRLSLRRWSLKAVVVIFVFGLPATAECRRVNRRFVGPVCDFKPESHLNMADCKPEPLNMNIFLDIEEMELLPEAVIFILPERSTIFENGAYQAEEISIDFHLDRTDMRQHVYQYTTLSVATDSILNKLFSLKLYTVKMEMTVILIHEATKFNVFSQLLTRRNIFVHVCGSFRRNWNLFTDGGDHLYRGSLENVTASLIIQINCDRCNSGQNDDNVGDNQWFLSEEYCYSNRFHLQTEHGNNFLMKPFSSATYESNNEYSKVVVSSLLIVLIGIIFYLKVRIKRIKACDRRCLLWILYCSFLMILDTILDTILVLMIGRKTHSEEKSSEKCCCNRRKKSFENTSSIEVSKEQEEIVTVDTVNCNGKKNVENCPSGCAIEVSAGQGETVADDSVSCLFSRNDHMVKESEDSKYECLQANPSFISEKMEKEDHHVHLTVPDDAGQGNDTANIHKTLQLKETEIHVDSTRKEFIHSSYEEVQQYILKERKYEKQQKFCTEEISEKGDLNEQGQGLLNRCNATTIQQSQQVLTCNQSEDTHHEEDVHYNAEIEDDDINVTLPDVVLGATGTTEVGEDSNFSTVECQTTAKEKLHKKKMLTVRVVPSPPVEFCRDSVKSDVKIAVSCFRNLKYKTRQAKQSKKEACTLTESEFEAIVAVRDYTWLPLSQLPVPKVDLTVAFVPQFEPLMSIIDQIANGTPPTPHISMRYELLRFCTLRSYPKENKPYLIKLAEAGFYYASDGDGVVCYCCGVRRYNWVAEDNPMKIHQRINPNCKFLKKNEEVNVPVKYFGPFSKSLMYIMSIPEPVERPEVNEDVNNDWAPERIRSPAQAQQNRPNEAGTNSLGINTAIPKHTQYATKTAREASFNGWSDTASHTPQELADAGFFFAGFGDCVRCFYCGIGLRHWTKDDNPWIEHARWSRNCVYVKQKKGEEFVNLVQLAVQYSQDNEAQANTTAGNQLPSQDIERLLVSDAAQSVLEMGYQPRIIKKAIEEILRQNSNAKIAAQNLMEKVLEIEEAENVSETAQAPAPTQAPAAAAAPQTVKPAPQTAKPAPQTAKPAPQTAKPETAKSLEGTKGAEPKTQHKDSKKGEGAVEAKAKTHEASKKDKGSSKESQDNDSTSQDPKAIKAENEQLKEQTLCKVCLDNTVCIVFLPCGHLVTCADCAPAMRKCPICRALVKGTVRTYMS